MTLASNDMFRVGELAENIHSVWSMPVNVVIALSMAWRLLGVATLPAIAIALLALAYNLHSSYAFTTIQDNLNSSQQQRLQALAEVLDVRQRFRVSTVFRCVMLFRGLSSQGIQVTKLLSLEHRIASKIRALRGSELHEVKRLSYKTASVVTVVRTASILMSVVALAFYYMLGNALTPSVIFPALYLFETVSFPIIQFPYTVSIVASTLSSVSRIHEFLCQDEVACTHGVSTTNESDVLSAKTSSGAGHSAITVRDANVQWQAKRKRIEYECHASWLSQLQSLCGSGGTAREVPLDRDTLRHVTLSIPKGELVAIVGPVGAGKSTLLAGLLGEAVTVTPTPLALHGHVVYCPQQAWIRSATIQDNILFGLPMSQSRYHKVIEACALGPDLAMFPLGDMTEVGERGVTLSGGQKQRISMARVLYSVLMSDGPSVCLLDDPLSAVDAHVGDHLFHEAVCGVLKRHTRVLVTHQLQFLPECVETCGCVWEGFVCGCRVVDR
jgi:ATP-binding cassette, subfamily C (CFTR/MRP), member 1